ncbi:MAG TPA: cell division protein FtsA, partial [Patescibacteria group bacterium]
MRDEIITGLDVGSTTIRIVVGQKIVDSNNEEKLHIIGVAETSAEGISKGVIVSIDDAVSSISSCLEKAERMAGVPIEQAYVGISGSHILSQGSKGVIAVSKANGEINEDDIERVIEAAQAVATPPNYEILHVIPRNFTVDNQMGIKDPLGMTGVRLEVEAQIIQGLSSQVKNLTKTIYRTGVDIEDLVLAVLAAAESVLSKRQKELGVALVNIGGSTTSLVVLEEGDVLHTSILPIGGGHITSDVAIGLRTSIDVAEKVKIEYGSAVPNNINKKDEINLAEFSSGDESTVSRKHVAEIIEARLEEIFELVDRDLKKINRSGLLPAGVVLTGGGARLEGIVEVAKKKFRLPASIGYPTEMASAIEKVNDPIFSAALGLVIWGSQL